MTRLEDYLLNDLEYEKIPNSKNGFCKKYDNHKASVWLNANHTKIEDYAFEVNQHLFFRSSAIYMQYQFELFLEDIEDLKRFEEKWSIMGS